jgi:hypothetical protein
MLLAGVKPAIRQIIKARIDEDQKNAAELWKLVRRFTTAFINGNDVQPHISQFRDTCGRLKHMGFEIPQWLQNDRFIDGLKGHQSGFIRAKRDEILIIISHTPYRLRHAVLLLS